MGTRPKIDPTKVMDRFYAALSCHNDDGGFGHYPRWDSDMDAVYFQFGTLPQCGWVSPAKRDFPGAHTLSWGHAMQPGKLYD